MQCLRLIFPRTNSDLVMQNFRGRLKPLFLVTIKPLNFAYFQVSDNYHNAIRIHHALATKATNYVKKQHVFRLQTAEQAEYLFQTSDSKELQSWIDTINFVCGAFSAPALPGGCGSSKRFQRPLLPCTHTKLSIVSFSFRFR